MKQINLCLFTALVFLLGFISLIVKLRELQVDDSSQYGYANARQSIRRVQTESCRGRILDRHGRVLAETRRSLAIVCQPSFFQYKTWDETVQQLTQAINDVALVIGRPPEISEKAIRRHINQSLAIPLTVWREISENELFAFSERAQEWPGFEVVETNERIYHYGSLAAHTIGYVGRGRGETQAGDERFNYFDPEMRGRSGLEFYYDSFLRGVPGERRVLVDARGFAIREWETLESRPGLDLTLSLDLDIQRTVERELEGEKGACAVINPRTGEVLALASAPSFDLNDFVPFLRYDVYQSYARDPDKPLLNRASGGLYAPGSTFKPVTALAGLTLGIPPEVTYDCDGVYRLGNFSLRCASRWGHGSIAMREAIMKSCNPYFCNLAMDVGTNALFVAARALGLGSLTGLDLGVDESGILPTAEWKQKKYHQPWYPGDLAQMGIGQGMLLVTPLQMACVAGAIGSGRLVRPHLKRDLPVESRPIPFAEEHLAVVREGMEWVVNGHNDTRGGGWRAAEDLPVTICGKTGTAEIGKGAMRRKNTWFIAYAPSVNPTLAIALIIENGDTGSTTAAPRVNAILKTALGVK